MIAKRTTRKNRLVVDEIASILVNNGEWTADIADAIFEVLSRHGILSSDFNGYACFPGCVSPETEAIESLKD